MEFFLKLKSYVLRVFDQSALGLSFLEILTVVVSFILSLFIRGFFAKVVVSKIKKIIQKTGNKVDAQLFDALAPPLKALPIIFVFIMIGLFVNTDTQISSLLDKINQTLVTIFIFWLIHQSLAPLSLAFQKLEELFSKALVLWLIRSLKYLIIFLISSGMEDLIIFISVNFINIFNFAILNIVPRITLCT